MTSSISDKFFGKVIIGPRCWLWTGKAHNGYGRFWVNKKSVYAHRFSYELYRGPIAPSLRVCHECDTPLCVNPDHLFIGSGQDNSWDMMRKERHWTVLTPEQALVIYHSAKSSRALAREYEVSKTLVIKIKNKQIWRHLHQ